MPLGVHAHTRKHTDVRGQNDFKKPGSDAWAADLRVPGLKSYIGPYCSTVDAASFGLAFE